MFTKYCADCYHMDTCPNYEGKFRCTNARKSGYTFVSARMEANNCNGFGYTRNDRRSESDKEKLMRISKSYGYYITSAITEILDLPGDNIYQTSFKYVRDIYMPASVEHQTFIEEYNALGPICARSLKQDEENKEYCGYLVACYLEPFSILVEEENIEDAIEIYKQMFTEVKRHYDIIQEKRHKLQK